MEICVFLFLLFLVIIILLRKVRKEIHIFRVWDNNLINLQYELNGGRVTGLVEKINIDVLRLI